MSGSLRSGEKKEDTKRILESEEAADVPLEKTIGKNDKRNEDFFGYKDTSFVIADGATDKSGKSYFGKTSGEIASRLAVKVVLENDLDGRGLIDCINSRIDQLYEELGVKQDVEEDPKLRFSTTLVCARIEGDKLVVTKLGDSGFRINGEDVYYEGKKIDDFTSTIRSQYIEDTGDIEGGRDEIRDFLNEQGKFRNQPPGEVPPDLIGDWREKANELGMSLEEFTYGKLEGVTEVSDSYVDTYEFNLSDVDKLELFTDGYFKVPEGDQVEDWEKCFSKVEKEDPGKWKKYPSTKGTADDNRATDDRTIAVINF